MKTKPTRHSFFKIISAICMMAAMLWLTVSLPFVYSYQQTLAKQFVATGADLPVANNDEETNSLGNRAEEKAPNTSTSFPEEYLSQHEEFFAFMLLNAVHKCKSESDYRAFHGELLSPPPNA